MLVVAGSLLRAEAGQVESDVLFRALRDFNIPKILTQVSARLAANPRPPPTLGLRGSMAPAAPGRQTPRLCSFA